MLSLLPNLLLLPPASEFLGGWGRGGINEHLENREAWIWGKGPQATVEAKKREGKMGLPTGSNVGPQLKNLNFAMQTAFEGLCIWLSQGQPLQQQGQWPSGCLGSFCGAASRRLLPKNNVLLGGGLQINLTAVSSRTFLLINLSNWLAPWENRNAQHQTSISFLFCSDQKN